MELEYFGYPEANAVGNLGMAMLFERRVRARGTSSAATEIRKIIGVPPEGGKIDLSEKINRFIVHLLYPQANYAR